MLINRSEDVYILICCCVDPPMPVYNVIKCPVGHLAVSLAVDYKFSLFAEQVSFHLYFKKITLLMLLKKI